MISGINWESFISMLHPGLIMIGLGLLAMILPRPLHRLIAIAAPAAAAWALFRMTEDSSISYSIAPYINVEFIHYGRFASILLLVLCVTALLAGVYGSGLQDRCESGMTLIYAGSVMGVILAGDCITLMFFWGITAAVSAYVIYAGHKKASSGASLRFILIQAAGFAALMSGLVIYMFHYGNAIQGVKTVYGEPCFWLIAAGAAVFIGVPPLHAWLADAYPESTETGTAYLTSFTAVAAAYISIRLFVDNGALVWAGAIASVFAVCMALLENDIRRTLAYIATGQIGMIIAAAGVGGEAARNAIAVHAVNVSLSMAVMMMAAGAVSRAAETGLITRLGSMGRKMPLTALCFVIASLSIAGVPGLPGYLSMSMITDMVDGSAGLVPGLLIRAGWVGTLLAAALKINAFVFFGGEADEERRRVILKPQFTSVLAMMAGAALIIANSVFRAGFMEILPYETTFEPYQIERLAGCAAMLIGGAIPFLLFLGRMKPDDRITLDFDWFFRFIGKIIRSKSIGNN